MAQCLTRERGSRWKAAAAEALAPKNLVNTEPDYFGPSIREHL